MTPEEKARAAAIIAAVSESAKARKRPITPAALLAEPKLASRAIFYAITAAAMLAIHVAGFLTYKHFTTAAEERERRHAQELENARELAAYEKAKTDHYLAALAKAKAEAGAYSKSQYVPQITPRTQPQQRTITPPPARTPKIEYNIYKEPRQRITPQTYQPVTQQAQTPTTPPPQDRTAEHQAAAIAHVIQKKGGYVRATATSPVPGWEGRYRTTGEAHFYQHNSSKTPSPRKFEVLTQETPSGITASDLTIKW